MTVNEELVAETRRARVLFETRAPPALVLPRRRREEGGAGAERTEDGLRVQGFASYWSVRAGDSQEDDLVWFYPEPRHDAERIAGDLAFFNERVDLEVDGELQERPETQWSKRTWRAPVG